MCNYNLHSSYLNLDILGQVEYTVSRRYLFPRDEVEWVFGEWPHWTGKLVFFGFWWFPQFCHNSSVLWPFSGKSWSSGCLFFSPKVGRVFLCFLIWTERCLWFYLPTEYKMPSRDYTGIREGIRTVGASSCLKNKTKNNGGETMSYSTHCGVKNILREGLLRDYRVKSCPGTAVPPTHPLRRAFMASFYGTWTSRVYLTYWSFNWNFLCQRICQKFCAILQWKREARSCFTWICHLSCDLSFS